MAEAASAAVRQRGNLATLDVLCVPVVVSRGQQVIHVNQAALEFFGHASSEALIGRTIGALIQMGRGLSSGAEWQDVVHFDRILGKPQGPRACLASRICFPREPPTGFGAAPLHTLLLARTAATALTAGSRRAMTMYSSRMGATGEFASVLCPHSEEELPAAPAASATPAPACAGEPDEWPVLELLPEPVLVVRNRTIVAVNDATLAVFGYDSKDELEGKPVTVLMPQADETVDRHHMTGEAGFMRRAPRGGPLPP